MTTPTPDPDGMSADVARPKGELVSHPTPGKAWVKVPHRNDISHDWIEVDLPDDVEAAREAFARGVAWANARLEAAEAKVAAVEALLEECASRLAKSPDRVLQFWNGQVRAALAHATPSDAPRGECRCRGMDEAPGCDHGAARLAHATPHAPQGAGSAQVAPGDADGLLGSHVDGERNE